MSEEKFSSPPPQLAHTEDQQRLRVAIAIHRGAQLAALFGVEPVAGRADQRICQLGEVDKALFYFSVAQQLAPGDHQHAAAAELAQDALERLFITHLGEQGAQIALVGGPALGALQIPGGEQFGQQLWLFEEGVGDKIGEAEQGQQRLANGLGLVAIVGGQFDQPLPLALGLFLQQGGEGRERGRKLGHGCRPCGSRQRVNDTGLTTLPVQNGGCQSSTVRPPRHSAGARSMIQKGKWVAGGDMKKGPAGPFCLCAVVTPA